MKGKKMASKGRKEKGPHKPKFPELPPKYSISRELRNKAEKMRRDRLNKLIEEIRMLVPSINSRSRKSDTTRTNILRLSANFLRLHNLFNSPKPSPPSPTSFMQEGLSHLQSMGGFLFMLLEDGRILYVSENVTKFIGYSQMEMMGWPIFNFIHPSDEAKLRSNLSRKKNKLHEKNSYVSSSPSSSATSTSQASPSPSTSSIPRSPSISVPSPSISMPSPSASMPSPSASNPSLDSNGEPKEHGVRQSFYIRLRERPMSKNDPVQYEHIHVVGHFKRSPGSLAKDERLKAKLGDDMVMNDGEYVFVGIMRPVKDRPMTELSLAEAIQDQYITRHLPDGRIIFSDHRIATITGYMPIEVQGKSAFNFIFGEDLPWTTMAQRHMFASSNGEGDTTYRLLARSGQLICLQSRGFLEFNKVTNKVDSFMCINTLIRDEDMERCLAEQKERFTPYITEFQLNSINSDKNSSMSMIPSLKCSPSSSSSLSLPKLSPSSSPHRIKSPPFSPGPILCEVKMETDEEIEENHNSSKKRKSSPGYDCLEKSAKYPRLSPERQIYQSSQNCRNQMQFPKSPQNPFDKYPLSPHGEQYIAREEPIHRLEGGNRVVDILTEEPSICSSAGLNNFPMDMFNQAAATSFSNQKSLSFSSIDHQNGGSKELSTFKNMSVWSEHDLVPKDEPQTGGNLLTVDTGNDELNVADSSAFTHRSSVIKSSNQPSVEDIVKRKLLLDLIGENALSGSTGYNCVDKPLAGFHTDNNGDNNSLNYSQDNNPQEYNHNNKTISYSLDNSALAFNVNVDQNTLSYPMDKSQNTLSYPMDKSQNTLSYPMDKSQNTLSYPIEKSQTTVGYNMEKSPNSKGYSMAKSPNSAGYTMQKSPKSMGYTMEKSQTTVGYPMEKTTVAYNSQVGFNVKQNTAGYHMDNYQKTDQQNSISEPTFQAEKQSITLPNIDVSNDDFDLVKSIKDNNKLFLR